MTCFFILFLNLLSCDATWKHSGSLFERWIESPVYFIAPLLPELIKLVDIIPYKELFVKFALSQTGFAVDGNDGFLLFSLDGKS